MEEEFDSFDKNYLDELIKKLDNYLIDRNEIFFDSEELLMLFDFFYEQENIKMLRHTISLALNLYPENIDLIVRNAQYISMDKGFQEAIHYILTYKAQYPNNPDIAFALGNMFSQIGNSNKAIEEFEICRKSDKKDIDVLLALADEFIFINDYNKASKTLKEALIIQPTDPKLLQSFIANAQNSIKVNSHLQFLYKLALDNPYSSENWMSYGLLLYHNENYFDAVTAFDFCIAISDKNVDAYLYKGLSFYFLDNTKAAISSLLEAINLAPQDPIILLSLAQTYEKEYDWNRALKYYKDSLNYNKRNYDAYLGIGMCYFEQNDFASAEPYMKKAIEGNPYNVQYKLAYAEMLYKENYIEQSEEIYNMLYDEGEELALCTINWALVMAERGNISDAIYLLKETIETKNIDDISLHLTLLEISVKDPSYESFVTDYLYKILLHYDLNIKVLEMYCPSIVLNSEYLKIINSYLNEKS